MKNLIQQKQYFRAQICDWFTNWYLNKFHEVRRSVVILVCLLGISLSGLAGWNAYQRHKIAVRLTVMNDIADKIIIASAQEALERGTAATALGSIGSADSDVIKKIQDLRKEGDISLNAALSAAKNIADNEPGSQFAAALEQTSRAYKALTDIRERVDTSLKEGKTDIQLIINWFTAITDVIEQSARLRQSAFVSSDHIHQISQDNLILKQAIWLISEYMGRERGTLGPIIAARIPVTHAMLDNLNSFHTVVNQNVSNILAQKGVKGIDSRLASAIGDMEKGLGSFETVRSDIYSAAGNGNYHLNSATWMELSTEAIEKVLAVSGVVTEISREKANKVTEESFHEMVLAIIQACLFLLFTLVLLLLVYNKVSRIKHLRESLDKMAHDDGGLTGRINQDSKDEIGRTAEALNSFIERINGIINRAKDIAERGTDPSSAGNSFSPEQMSYSSTAMRAKLITLTAAEEVVRAGEELKLLVNRQRSFLSAAKQAEQPGEEG
ncbi:MAG: HAMP domain-containing protein [Nitrospirae bacterium]|nr:HAMP domain-containing protein [Nitrospirota bacterium]